jgi:hypothetical protein
MLDSLPVSRLLYVYSKCGQSSLIQLLHPLNKYIYVGVFLRVEIWQSAFRLISIDYDARFCNCIDLKCHKNGPKSL